MTGAPFHHQLAAVARRPGHDVVLEVDSAAGTRKGTGPRHDRVLASPRKLVSLLIKPPLERIDERQRAARIAAGAGVVAIGVQTTDKVSVPIARIAPFGLLCTWLKVSVYQQPIRLPAIVLAKAGARPGAAVLVAAVEETPHLIDSPGACHSATVSTSRKSTTSDAQ
jgi:hypothetical protein